MSGCAPLLSSPDQGVEPQQCKLPWDMLVSFYPARLPVNYHRGSIYLATYTNHHGRVYLLPVRTTMIKLTWLPVHYSNTIQQIFLPTVSSFGIKISQLSAAADNFKPQECANEADRKVLYSGGHAPQKSPQTRPSVVTAERVNVRCKPL